MKNIRARLKLFIFKIKYKLNKYKKNSLIPVNDSHRQIGLSTVLIKDALKHKYKILVSNKVTAIHLSKMMWKLDGGEYHDCITPVTYIDYFITTMELCSDVFHRGKIKYKILVDNSCNHDDVIVALSSDFCEIVNGFVYIQYIK